MIPLNLEKAVTVKHISGSTEFHGDEEKLLATIKLEGFFPVDEITELFGSEEMDLDAFKKAFWNKKGEKVCDVDHKFGFDYAVQGLRFEILVDSVKDQARSVFISMEARLKGFVGEFSIHEKMDITFSVMCNVTKDQIAELFDHLNQVVTIKLEPIQGDMLED